jgi:tRNA/tmRNA/rRNA uracil-C5-methylase (TrmA/RlmC/RlmD family)
MGAPTSAILAETFIQFLEHTVIYKILEKHQIIAYYRHVDEILLIYNSEHTNIHNTLQEFNTVHPNLKFTFETEIRNKINYLGITINKQQDKLTFGIYRKPTTTDTIIHNNSCHPNEHKRSAINYLSNRMNTYHLTPENKAQENAIINAILTNNGYEQLITHPNHKHTSPNTNSKNKMGNFHIPWPRY